MRHGLPLSKVISGFGDHEVQIVHSDIEKRVLVKRPGHKPTTGQTIYILGNNVRGMGISKAGKEAIGPPKDAEGFQTPQQKFD